MKNNKKSIVVGLTTTLLLGAVAACGNKGGGGSSKWNVDGPNKVKINTVNFAGGIGNKWLEDAAERFAKEMAEYEFTDGKKGVYINTSYTTFYEETGPAMLKTNYQVYFDERMSDVQKLADLNCLLDLDSIVKDSSRTGGSLESQIFDTMKEGLQVEKLDGKHYYGLPHYEYYGGLTYNWDVFKELGAFFVDESVDEELCLEYYAQLTASSEDKLHGRLASVYLDQPGCTLSCGPDGVKGTDDDGLPRTLDEFVILMDYIKFRGYNPIALSGAYTRYMDYTLSGLWASFAGAQQMTNYYNCTGEIEVVKRDGEGNILYETDGKGQPINLITGLDYIKKPQTEVINMDDPQGKKGYKGNDMAAKYYALAVMDVIYNGQFLTQHAADGGCNHYDAQRDLFFGNATESTQKSAMLIEGTYWYNETEEMASQLTLYERLTGKSRYNLNLKWMALPTSVVKCDELEQDPSKFVGKEQCLLDIGHAYTMINKNVEDNASLKDACLKFVAFLYSEQELINFTASTGLSRMVKYTVPQSVVDGWQPYYKALYKIREKNTANLIGLSGNTPCFTLNKDNLKIELQSNCICAPGTNKPTLYSLLQANNHAADVHNKYLRTTEANWVVPTE